MDERRQAVEATTMVTAAHPGLWRGWGGSCFPNSPTPRSCGATLTRLVPPLLHQFHIQPSSPTMLDHQASFHLHPWVKPTGMAGIDPLGFATSVRWKGGEEGGEGCQG